MTQALELPAVFAIGVLAAVVGVMVGGGSLLSIPFLIFVGLPAPVAIATDRFAGLGVGVTAFVRFRRAGRIVWPLVPVLTAASLVGSLVGASLLVEADPAALRGVVGVLLLALLPVLFLRPRTGLERRETGRAWRALGLLVYLAIQVLSGFFGGGTGTLIFYTLMFFFGVTVIEVAATQVVPFLALTLASLVLFAWHGMIDYERGVVLMAGTAVGGWLGAHVAVRSGDVWVRRLFAVVVVASAAGLLLG